METHLKDKVVIITGASGGIGAEVARKFAKEGARLALHYRHGREQVNNLVEELQTTEVLPVRADLTKEAEVKQVFAATMRRFGKVDTLIANASSWETNEVPLERMSSRQWHKTVNNVLTCTFYTVREFLRIVARQRRGNLVLVGSTAAVFGEAGHADYAASKAAVAYGLTRSLKNEIVRLAPHTRNYCGGRVNCVCPGWTVVPRLAAKLADQKTIRKVTCTMALPQLGRPDDVANCIIFLSSDHLSRHLTGQTLVIAGGMEGRRLWDEQEIESGIV